MAAKIHIDNTTEIEIKKSVDNVLNEIACLTPPVSFQDIFLSQNLSCHLFDSKSNDYQALVKQVGADAEALRGCLFVNDKTIIVRDDGYARRNNFVYGHEVGHWALPWHKALLYQCTQFDLSTKASAQLEREANFFSGELCFMGGKFVEFIHSYELTIENLIKFSDMFDMSREATFRKVIEQTHRPAALMALKNNGQTDSLMSVHYIVHSKSFRKDYGFIKYDNKFQKEHVLMKIITDPLTSYQNYHYAKIKFGEEILDAEVWRNKWNVFVLLTPEQKG